MKTGIFYLLVILVAAGCTPQLENSRKMKADAASEINQKQIKRFILTAQRTSLTIDEGVVHRGLQL